MKALSFILALVAVPAFVAYADDNAGAMEGYLPTNGNLARGVQVRLDIVPIREQLENFTRALQKLTPEKREAYLKGNTLDLSMQPVYDAEVWPSKEEYDSYVEAWRKIVHPVTEVAVGLQKTAQGTWRVLSATVDAQTKAQIPLTVSALRYDAERNVWISNNGELKAKEYSVSDASIYGAQTGTEWVLEKKDSLALLRESIHVTRTTDDKFVYLAYTLEERSAVTGSNIAQGEYRLQFPVQKPGANLGTPGQR